MSTVNLIVINIHAGAVMENAGGVTAGLKCREVTQEQIQQLRSGATVSSPQFQCTEACHTWQWRQWSTPGTKWHELHLVTGRVPEDGLRGSWSVRKNGGGGYVFQDREFTMSEQQRHVRVYGILCSILKESFTNEFSIFLINLSLIPS